MLELLLSAVLLAPLPLPDDGQGIAPPDPAVVEATLDRLEAAWAAKEVPDIVAALEAARPVLAKKVIKAVARGLKHKEAKVRAAAIESLRWMDHPAALDALHDACKRNKSLRKDDVLSAALLRAIGQHADASSLKLLEDNPGGTTNFKALQARIFALGRIRTDDSLAAILQMMNKFGARGLRGNNNRFMAEFRMSLTVLTGQDLGPRREDWVRWWNNNKHSFHVSPTRPKLPPAIQRKWFTYWGLKEPPAKKRKKPPGGR